MDSKVEYLQRLWLGGCTPFESIHIIYKMFGTVLSGYAVMQQFATWEESSTQLGRTLYVAQLLRKIRGVA